MAAMAGFGKPKSKREPVEVAEPKPLDKSLDQLLNVRKQRLDRMERERKQAQEAWKNARLKLRELKHAWRQLVADTKAYWQEARNAFLSMQSTSGQFRKAKVVYERMKGQSTDARIACLDMVKHCKKARRAFFTAKDQVLTANRQQEKLTFMRDEIRAQQQQSEG